MEAVTVLAAGSEKLLGEFRRILTHTRWMLVEASTLAETLAVLREGPQVVVVCEPVFSDGSWYGLLRHTLFWPVKPPVIVVAPDADESLGMEVLNRGGYSVLTVPFVDREVFQVVSQAWLHLRNVANAPLIV